MENDDFKVINPFVDWSFKYLFGREESKELLIGLINIVLEPRERIVDLTYLNTEVVPETEEMRRSVFDVLCRDENGDEFIVEMQNGPYPNRQTDWCIMPAALLTAKE